MYGYFWRRGDGAYASTPGSTVSFLRQVCDGDVYDVRALAHRKRCPGWPGYSRQWQGEAEWRNGSIDAFQVRVQSDYKTPDCGLPLANP